jgi:hypothetical protein
MVGNERKTGVMAKYFKWGCFGCSGIILLLFLSCTACNYFLGERIMRGKIFHGLIPYVEFTSPPKDLYTPIFSQQIDATKIDTTQTFKIKHKYVGEYNVYLEVSNIHSKHIKNMSTKGYEFKLDMNFWVDKTSFFHRTILCEPSFILNSDFYIDNVSQWILHYSVPKNVPNGKEIDLELTIHKDIENFYNKFGNPTIEIRYETWSTEYSLRD